MNGYSIKYFIRSFLIMGGEQNFLGAFWIPTALALTPKYFRIRLAKRFLSLSPHYFYGEGIWLTRDEIRSEEARNNESRKQLVDDILKNFIEPHMVVLDYGCGPGYLAKHVSPYVSKLHAVDISNGVLACARQINPGSPNIEYQNINSGLPSEKCQLVYSFAVFQHLNKEAIRQATQYIFNSLVKGGKAVIHFVVDDTGFWVRESPPENIPGKLRRTFGLNCFSRSRDEIIGFFKTAGFSKIKIQPARELTNISDDIKEQHILTATKPS